MTTVLAVTAYIAVGLLVARRASRVLGLLPDEQGDGVVVALVALAWPVIVTLAALDRAGRALLAIVRRDDR